MPRICHGCSWCIFCKGDYCIMKVIFSDRAYVNILAETTEKIKTETGGLFLGTVYHDQWYVIEAIDPGPKSIFQVAYFEYDQTYTQHLINKIANLYDAQLSLIGLWHRHPGSFDQFSSTDDGTNSKYAKMRLEGAISALVNIDPTFRLTLYHVAQPCRYSIIEYDVGDHLIPNELLKYKTPERFEKIMENVLNGNRIKKSLEDNSSKMSFYEFMKSIYPYLKKYKLNVQNSCDDETIAERILDEIVEDVIYLTDICGVSLVISQSGSYICISDENFQDNTLKLYFKYTEDTNGVVFSLGNDCFRYKRNIFAEAYKRASENRKVAELDTNSQQVSFFRDTIKIIRKMAKNGD